MNEEAIHEQEGEVVKIIEALGRIESSEDWSTLKRYVLDGFVDKLERRLLSEAKTEEPSLNEIYKLQGQLLWAKKYSDLSILIQEYRTRLLGLRKRLNQPTSWVPDEMIPYDKY